MRLLLLDGYLRGIGGGGGQWRLKAPKCPRGRRVGGIETTLVQAERKKRKVGGRGWGS